MKLGNDVASRIMQDGASMIPGFSLGYVIVGGNKIALDLSRPPIFHHSLVNCTAGSATLTAERYYPFPLLLVGIAGIVKTTLQGTAAINYGNSATAGAYLLNYAGAGANMSAGDTFNAATSLVGYDASTATAIAIPAGTRLAFGTGTGSTAGVVDMTAVLVPNY